MEPQTETNDVKSELRLKSKLGLKQQKNDIKAFLSEAKLSEGPAKNYYQQLLQEIKTEIKERKTKTPTVKMPKSALLQLCSIYAPTLKFSKEALGFLEQVIKIETAQVFKKLKIFANMRNSKTIKV